MATGRVPTTANSPLTAKGDLFTYSTAPARLAVGNNGEQIVADSSTSTGLRYQASMAAGKNAIINGAFNVWQRGTSFTNPAASAYLADRFSIDYNTGTVACVVSQQTFTPGTAPVSGYESQYFLRVSQSAATASKFIYVGQRIEDVRTFAGQTVTFSFWAKANATKTLKSRAVQIFGSGGSSGVGTSETSNTITTSWARYTNTITVPSVSGKTIGTGSYVLFDLNWDSNAIQDIDIWGFQVEAGSVATAFQTATGTIQGELAACQRYFQTYGGSSARTYIAQGSSFSATRAYISLTYPVPMRTSATLTLSSATHFTIAQDSQNFVGTSNAVEDVSSTGIWIDFTHGTGATAGRGATFYGNTTSARFQLSAEL